MDCDLDACFKTVSQLARDAGLMIKEAYSQKKIIETKSCAADLVTETDQNVERFIISSLKEHFPTHSFIGEESVAAGEKCNLTENPTWIIDPIDGTTNFVHRFPYTCISIALVVQKETEIGLVYNPVLNEMFTARRGKGSFLNEKPIHATDTEDLTEALILCEFGSSRNPEEMDLKFKGMRNIIQYCHGIRDCGSAAMHLCQVARGSADGYCIMGIHCWDYAAGELIVREAGGFTMDTKGTSDSNHFKDHVPRSMLKHIMRGRGHRIRSIGSCALAMTMVAKGNGDGYYEFGVHSWDMAAGILLVQESGGVVMDTSGGPVDLMSRRILCAGTEKLAKQLAAKIVHVEYERD